jgi:hypothetical protein
VRWAEPKKLSTKRKPAFREEVYEEIDVQQSKEVNCRTKVYIMWEKRDRAFRCLVISPAGLAESRAPGGIAAGSESVE